jgi:hypothetical protein
MVEQWIEGFKDELYADYGSISQELEEWKIKILI